jgi:outer membrane lipoprotein LolB
MRRLQPLLWSVLTAGLLSACAVPPTRGSTAAVGEAFRLEARFSLHYTPPAGGAAQQFVGQLEWQHAPGSDHLFLRDPFGQGVAEIWRTAAAPLELQLADGRRQTGEDAERLLVDLLGVPLPLEELSGWVRAQPGAGALVEPDAEGRPWRVRESGWLLTLRYADPADRLPARLDASLDGVVKLRLALERWAPLP